MNLHQLRIFCTIVEEGSFRQAAEKLFLSQPSVSQQVAALEKSYDVRLFERKGRSVSLTPEVRETFLRYPWPGNVRELKNIIERIFILRDNAGGDIALRDLPGDMLDALPREESDLPHGGSLPETLQEYERRMLEEALARSDGKRGRAARELGISRFALLRRMQRLGMEQGNGTA